MKTRKQIFIFIIIVCIAAVCANAGSIWAKRNKTTRSLYSDDKAFQVGDILTVIINVDSKLENNIDRDLKKTTSHKLDFDGREMETDAGDFLGHLIPNMPVFKMEATSEKSLNGEADYTDERSFDDRVTVIVEDIHPNGNMVILGTHTRNIAGDKQEIQISGIVRPSDISFNNTVLSSQVANFNIVTINKGISENYIKPGWLGRLLDALWPL